METTLNVLDRRDFCKLSSVVLSSYCLPSLVLAKNDKNKLIQKIIPASKLSIPVIGMGTWITFNVGANRKLRDARTEVLKEFFKYGGALIDSSPMYGSAQDVLGYGLKKIGYPKQLFAADKIWTSSTSEGVEQFKEMKDLWGLKKFSLVQVHNLLNWKAHLKRLRKLKSEGQVGHIGITTSHGRDHAELESIMKQEAIDFVQLTYNITHRQVEDRLLSLAYDKGIAVIANRPYDGGDLMDKYKSSKLPPVAKEAGLKTWAELFLKWVVSHPAITVAIPATSKVKHMQENMGACRGQLLDEKQRQVIGKLFV